MAIQWTHRLGALVVMAMFIYLMLKTPRSNDHLKNNRAIKFCLVFLVMQIALGIANAIYLLPLSLALLHNTVAMLLWLSAINGLTLYEEDTEVAACEQELLA